MNRWERFIQEPDSGLVEGFPSARTALFALPSAMGSAATTADLAAPCSYKNRVPGSPGGTFDFEDLARPLSIEISGLRILEEVSS